VIAGGVTIASVKARLAVVPTKSVTVAVNVTVAAAAGVPVIAPVEGFNDSVVGKAPVVIDHV
jgi:hypothetical protein